MIDDVEQLFKEYVDLKASPASKSDPSVNVEELSLVYEGKICDLQAEIFELKKNINTEVIQSNQSVDIESLHLEYEAKIYDLQAEIYQLKKGKNIEITTGPDPELVSKLKDEFHRAKLDLSIAAEYNEAQFKKLETKEQDLSDRLRQMNRLLDA